MGFLNYCKYFKMIEVEMDEWVGSECGVLVSIPLSRTRSPREYL